MPVQARRVGVQVRALWGSHTDENGRDLRVCDGQLVIYGRFTVGE
jgi:hypothetical protein